MNLISAEIKADSINVYNGARVTTFVLKLPRIVLAEFNTHRMLSKNSASSRAIPFEKMVKYVKDSPFIPIKFMKNHKGMQGSDYFTEETDVKRLTAQWLRARDSAVAHAENLFDGGDGLTKQLVNRILEPFLYHTVIVTASDWGNYTALRAHPAAEIHIADLAEKMLKAYNESTPKVLQVGEWHIPFGDKFDDNKIRELVNIGNSLSINKVKIATARCARVSYMNFDGSDDYSKDLKLHDDLSVQGHWSPFEHCAIAAEHKEYSGNLFGFTQYRKLFEGENKNDPRIESKTSEPHSNIFL